MTLSVISAFSKKFHFGQTCSSSHNNPTTSYSCTEDYIDNVPNTLQCMLQLRERRRGRWCNSSTSPRPTTLGHHLRHPRSLVVAFTASLRPHRLVLFPIASLSFLLSRRLRCGSNLIVTGATEKGKGERGRVNGDGQARLDGSLARLFPFTHPLSPAFACPSLLSLHRLLSRRSLVLVHASAPIHPPKHAQVDLHSSTISSHTLAARRSSIHCPPPTC
ncbi:hypothetical protein BDN70DRAFT_42597 [Pholiota conissans]|uniref:Uncharacterized protein n=1 Tax=Pholiota conissans TaxID=109636 RepID=A0A9P5YJ19_9AGAR|nr:hypothetical protein BDN70DRAFT_42597 [Pholiota conissans]